jgi:ATP-binding cassette subfamily C protein
MATLERRCLEAREIRVQAAWELNVQRGIQMRGVTFVYPRRPEPPALRDLTLDIAAGRTTAIVGPSGAGKSTLADLIIGLLQPTSGQLYVDGTPLGPERLPSWRSRIGYVSQDTVLLHDTVRANLAWARRGATETELWQAIRLAAADFVGELPHGLDTVVGERGVLLSGGERQRLALARALLRRPEVLILDEATSSLDSENELRIQEAIEGLHRRLTILIITHRLSTIRSADIIYVLDQGRIVESGSWLSLGADGKRFRDLCQAQNIDVDSSGSFLRMSIGNRSTARANS